jgi:hypothetical protein
VLNAPMSVVASTAIPAHSSRSKVLGQKAARLRKILILHSPGGDVGENYIKRSDIPVNVGNHSIVITDR